ncbi:dTDP-4-dehydrorhamnose 3,5-epimerase [Acidovorax sp. SRB_24]|uniref:dTDP-4-dehydrorhamnose 3,5-epimerase n=1 Tax=Acidovorax sp. SRB_24 TaxID=1962700 RepID=UPI00145C4063|nr:dTDP-4-dehydrorhamnose 3,5-epimerase [Acidovorax sp. SRB_24]
MKFIETRISGVFIVEPKVFGDQRGFFMESYNAQAWAKTIGETQFVQDNHSRSGRGVLRGLHYQQSPFAQGKLVRVTRGAVFDVAVDIRQSSPTFGEWVGAELTEENHRQLWVPVGFAHGFLTLTDGVDFLYKTTAPYAPSHERAIAWNDPDIGIMWPDVGAAPQLSGKDQIAPTLRDIAPQHLFP